MQANKPITGEWCQEPVPFAHVASPMWALVSNGYIEYSMGVEAYMLRTGSQPSNHHILISSNLPYYKYKS